MTGRITAAEYRACGGDVDELDRLRSARAAQLAAAKADHPAGARWRDKREDTAEKLWQARVEQVARRNGWRVYHPHDSRRSEPGWPDLFAVRAGRAVAAELKTRGQPTAAQQAWLADLDQVPGIETHVWYPADEDEMQATLR